MTGLISSVISALFKLFWSIFIWVKEAPSLQLSYNISTGVQEGSGETYLAALITVSNPGKTPIYFGGFQAIGFDGKTFYPLCSIPAGARIDPGQYIQGTIPAYHLVPHAKALIALDGVGNSYRLGRSDFKTLTEKLAAEAERLKSYGLK